MEILAHGLGGRSDLPIPLWLAVYGATAAVLISFYAVARFWRRPLFQGPPGGRPLPRWVQRVADSPATRAALRLIGFVSFAGLLIAAWLGPDDSAVNPAPTWFYVWWWVGLVPASLLFGPIIRLISPLRTATGLLRRLLRRDRVADDLVARCGWWPAAVSLVAFLWLELVSDFSDSPRAVATFLTVYTIVHVAIGVVVGPRWFDRGEGFEAYSSLLASMSPLGRRADGQLALRNPFDGLSRLSPVDGAVVPAGLVPFCCLLLGSTAFDGLTRTALWRSLSRSFDGPIESALLGTAGLVASVLVVTGIYLLAARLTVPFLPRERRRTRAAAAAFVGSLVPVIIGYTLAHYFSFAVFQGQAGWTLGSVADINYTVVSPTTIALVQVAAIVAGHIGGVVAAHDRALELLPRKNLTAGQYPMLTTMVGFTTLGIALLAGS